MLQRWGRQRAAYPDQLLNSQITYKSAIGCCANPAKPGTPGGGSGGATYTDGGTPDLTIAAATSLRAQRTIDPAELRQLPRISYLGNASPVITNSTIQ